MHPRVVMPQQLRATPDSLTRIGNQLADHGESLLALQLSCLGTAEEAHPGWVGSSALALSGLLDGWAMTSTAHIARFGEHSRGMHFAAAGFRQMEQRNTAALAWPS
ncbi:hypothetical protein [Mycobacterium sp. 1164966.3]|uniref:hypothetical protein n=1 Tax=Mycobacterium sp. 1164966.3 TaxID=1856861 RepID=UPI0020A518E5|nr:hypothetical protein [Mycobacterium sp. 1164966.3]